MISDRNFLKFEWQGNYFRFTCLPNGLASAPRLFTKVLKPIYAHLRSLWHFCMGHIDDSFLMCHLSLPYLLDPKRMVAIGLF